MFGVFLLPLPARGQPAPQLWVFYKYLHALRNEAVFFGSEDYLAEPAAMAAEGRQEPLEKSAQALGYHIPTVGELASVPFFRVPADLTEGLVARFGGNATRAWEYLLTTVDPALTKWIEDALQRAKKRHGPLRCMLAWSNCPSLTEACRQGDIPLVHCEYGPLRHPDYVATGYLDFSGVNGFTEVAKRYSAWVQQGSRRVRPRTLAELQGFVGMAKGDERNDFALGVALQVEDDSNVIAFSNGFDNQKLLNLARRMAPESQILVRSHPSSCFVFTKGAGVRDDSPNSGAFLDRVRRLLTINSSVGLEALVRGKHVEVVGDAPYRFVTEYPTLSEEWLRRLEFFLLNYLVPLPKIFDPEYLLWRLERPSEEQIRARHTMDSDAALSALQSARSSAGVPRIQSIVESHAPPLSQLVSTTASLYLDGADGRVFSEERAVHSAFLLDGHLQRVTLQVPHQQDAPIGALRLDIANRICVVDLVRLCVVSNEEEVWCWEASSGMLPPWSESAAMLVDRQPAAGYLRIVCLNDDPQCLLSLPPTAIGALLAGGTLVAEVRASLLAPPETPGVGRLAEVLASGLEGARTRLDELAARLQAEFSALNAALAATRSTAQDSEREVSSLREACQRERDRADAALARAARLEARLEALSTELESTRARLMQREGTVNELTQFVSHLERLASEQESSKNLAEANVSILREQSAIVTAIRDGHSSLAERVDHALEELIASKKALAAELEQARTQIASYTASVHHWQAVASGLERDVAQLRASRSWRLTRPLRAAGHAVRSARIILSPRAVASRTARALYRVLPIPTPLKRRAKDWVFERAPGLFAHTLAYRQWRTHRAELEALAKLQFEMPAHDQSGVAGSVGFEEAGAPLTVTTAPAAGGAHGNLLPAELPEADGRWEWSDYAHVRERILRAHQGRRASVRVKPVPMIDIAETELDESIRRIRLQMATEAPDVSILVPTYNNLKYTVECLLSISSFPPACTYEVVIADDASSDSTAERLAHVPNLRVLTSPKNLGFLRNVNRAIPALKGRFTVLLNNDVQVQEGWLDALVERAEASDDVGAVGPMIVYPSGHLQEAGCALRPDGTAEMIGLNDSPEDPRYKFARCVDYCSGACLLVPTKLFAQLGGFDERFAPAYCEDSDLGLRLRERGLKVYYEPKAVVVHHLSKTTASQSVDDKLQLVGRNLERFVRKWQETIDEISDVRIIAFYLPQFHPIPQNDRWWGKGFTEWRNVAKALPNFVGHYQPRLPADLGYYDLQVPEVAEQQAMLARRYGVTGFCYYYYWFGGQRLLEMPIERILRTGRPELPFCLCWANENWTRRWDGQDQEILMAQAHSPEDDAAVIRDLIRYMRCPNYIRIDGKPLLLVYRVTLFPDFAATSEIWRRICREEGIGEIYLAMVESFEMVFSNTHPSRYGCDAAVEFPPQGLAEPAPPSGAVLNPNFKGHVADYRDLAVRYCLREQPPYVRFRGLMPGWDNTARRQNNSFCFEHATPGAFQAWAEFIIEQTRAQLAGDERIVFVNAWNEWAEGAYLEPDRRFGHTFLEAIRNAKDSALLKRRGRYALQ